MKDEILEMSDLLFSAALNGVFQGILLVVLVGVGLRCIGKTNAATRYVVWFCTLLLVAILPVAHVVRGILSTARAALVARSDGSRLQALSAGPNSVETISPDNEAGNAALKQQQQDEQHAILKESQDSAGRKPLPPEGDVPAEESEFFTWAPPSETSLAPLYPGPDLLQNDTLGNEPPALTGQMGIVSDSPPTASLEQSSSLEARANRKTLVGYIRGFFGDPIAWNVFLGGRVPWYASVALLAVWAIGSAFKGGVLLRGLGSIRRLKRASFEAGSELNRIFQSLRVRLGIKRPVRIRVSGELKSPVLLGFCRPVVLYPMQGDVGQAEPVLRHELAHVQRRDDWTNLVQQFIDAFLFFHPGVWWVSRRLSLEREIACDDQVLQECARPHAYALLLTNLAGRMQGGQSLLAPGVSTNKSQLKQRIDMILDMNRNKSSRLERTRVGLITCAALVAAVTAIYAAPRIVVAQGEPGADSAPQIADVNAEVTVDVDADVNVDVNADVAVESQSGSTSEQSVDAAPVAPAPPGAPAGVMPPKPPTPADIAPGPKYKPGEMKIVPHPPTVMMVAPTPAPAPNALVSPAPMIAVVGPDKPQVYVGGPAPRKKDRDSSLEERLDRLERMMEKLMTEPGMKPRVDLHWKGNMDQDWKMDRKEIEKNEQLAKRQAEDAKRQVDDVKRQMDEAKRQVDDAKRQMQFAYKQMDEQQIEKMKEAAKKDAMRAADEARRAGREAGRALAEQRRGDRERMKDGSEKQLEALRRHQEELKREMERLDRQIKEIERRRDQVDGDIDEPIEQNENGNENDNSNENSVATAQPAAR